MQCPKCGYENPNDISVCINCRYKIYEKDKPTETQIKENKKVSGQLSFFLALVCILFIFLMPNIMFLIGDGIYLLIILFFAVPSLKEDYEELFSGDFNKYLRYRFKNILNINEIGDTLNFIVCILFPFVLILGLFAMLFLG